MSATTVGVGAVCIRASTRKCGDARTGIYAFYINERRFELLKGRSLMIGIRASKI